MFGPKQGSAHFVLLVIMALVAALFVLVGKNKQEFRLPGSLPRENARQIKFWPELKVPKENKGNALGVEFSTNGKPATRDRLSEYYPDTQVPR